MKLFNFKKENYRFDAFNMGFTFSCYFGQSIGALLFTNGHFIGAQRQNQGPRTNTENTLTQICQRNMSRDQNSPSLYKFAVLYLFNFFTCTYSTRWQV